MPLLQCLVGSREAGRATGLVVARTLGLGERGAGLFPWTDTREAPRGRTESQNTSLTGN